MRMRGGVRRFQTGGVNPAMPAGGAGTGPFAAGAPANGLGAAPGLNPQAIQQALQQRRSMAGGPPAPGAPAGAPAAGWPGTQGMPPAGGPPGAGMPPGVGGPPPPGAGMPPQGAPPQGMPPGGMPMRPGMGPPPAAAAPAAAVPAAAQSAGVNPALVRPPGMAHGGEVSEDGDKGARKTKRFSEFKTKAAEDIPEVEKKAKGGAIKRRKPPAPRAKKALPPPPPPQLGEDDEPDLPPPPPPSIGGGPVSAPPPPGMKKGGKWIQDMHMKEGALHKNLGVPEDKKIPKKKLNAAAKKGGKVGERARAAKTLGKFAKGGKSSCDKMAAGGAAKVRRGFPNVNKAPGKMAAGGPVRLAAGGKVRGCGAATKGCNFSGVY